MAQESPTTTRQPESDAAALAAGAIGSASFAPAEPAKKAADPYDKTVRESRYISVGGRTVKSSPLGVDPGYMAPYQGQRVESSRQADSLFGGDPFADGIAARYDPTDLDMLAGLSPESIFQIQTKLAQSKIISGFQKGIFDDHTMNGMSKVMAYANRRGLLWQDALEEFAANPLMSAGGGGGGARGPVFRARLTNPDDLRKTFKQVAYNTTGGNFLDDGAYERMVQSYQDAELKAQRAQFNAAISGGTTVDQPSAQTFAEDELEETDDAQAHSIMQYGSVFERLLGGG